MVRLDEFELKTLLPTFLSLVNVCGAPKIVDLGCGTGRNLRQLLSIPSATIVGLDASPKMLEVAIKQCNALSEILAVSPQANEVTFGIHEVRTGAELPKIAQEADGIISILVLEHLSLETFFATCVDAVKLHGYVLLTSIHGELAQQTQAGFSCPASGERIRPVSYPHQMEGILSEAGKWGFEVVGEVREISITQGMVQNLGRGSAKWAGTGIKAWFGVILTKTTLERLDKSGER